MSDDSFIIFCLFQKRIVKTKLEEINKLSQRVITLQGANIPAETDGLADPTAERGNDRHVATDRGDDRQLLTDKSKPCSLDWSGDALVGAMSVLISPNLKNK